MRKKAGPNREPIARAMKGDGRATEVSRSPRRKRKAIPANLPDSYPNELRILTEVIVTETASKFPVPTQILNMCRHIVSKITPVIFDAVQNNKLSARLAEPRVGELIHYLLMHHCNDRGRPRCAREIRRSREWLHLMREIARAEARRKAARTD